MEKYNLIPLTEYAKMHGKEESTVRRKALRNGFITAIGRDWFIDRDEPYIVPSQKKLRLTGTFYIIMKGQYL